MPLPGGWGGGGVLLEILGRCVPPCSPNPDPISVQNMLFSTPVLDLASKIQTRFLDLASGVIKLRISAEVNNSVVKFARKFSSNDIFWMLYFLYYSFGVEKTNKFMRCRGSLEN